MVWASFAGKWGKILADGRTVAPVLRLDVDDEEGRGGGVHWEGGALGGGQACRLAGHFCSGGMRSTDSAFEGGIDPL